jgi:D-threonate/D-erythronate kinase
MERFYIIADDLTGANDAGVQLSKLGIRSTVFLDLNESIQLPTEGAAIVDTDSRALDEQAAYQKARNMSSIFYQQGYQHVYKKMDSTLRGNVAAELAAVVSVHQPEIVVVAPAFPKMMRQTMKGYQYVNGQLVSETEFGRDPKTPVKDSFISNLLKEHVEDRICLMDQSTVHSPYVQEWIKEHTGQGRTWFICDAANDEELAIIADAFAGVSKKTVWAGSAGLIEFLPKALGLQNEGARNEELAITKTLTVSASLSEVTKHQLETVRKMPDSYLVEVNPVDLIKKTYCLQTILAAIAEQPTKDHIVLFVDSSADNRKATKQLETELLLSKTQIGEAISRELGLISRAIIHTFSDINGLVLTGGDTAKAVCNQLEMNQMQLYTEVETGLPIGKMIGGGDDRQFWTVTKAGGFGNENSLKNALKYMKRKVG